MPEPMNVFVVSDPDNEPQGTTSFVPDRRSQTALPSSTSAKNPATDTHDIFHRIKVKDISSTTRQLATLIHAGMPLTPALSALVEQFEDESMGPILLDVRDRVNNGSNLADALEQHPRIFSPLYINMVRVGQTSGTLETILLKLADLLDKRERLTGKVKSAVAYPLLMAVMAAAVVIFLMTFVIPGITKIFLDMNQQLPWPTTLLISVSTFFKGYLLWILLALCVLLLLVRTYLQNESGRCKWDRLKLKLPLFGGFFTKIEAARLSRTLGILIGSGIPVLKALDIVIDIIQNRYMANALRDAQTEVERGTGIAQAIRNTKLFSPIMYHMIATGEISGDIENSLTDIADTYDTEIENTTRSLTSLLEPVILLLMGTIIGFMVLAILLPIFEINQSL